jgi:hypothetical protein
MIAKLHKTLGMSGPKDEASMELKKRNYSTMLEQSQIYQDTESLSND